MFDVTNTSEATMTSLQLSSMSGKRHDNVKVIVKDLIEKEIIAVPEIQETPTPGGGKPVSSYVFRGDQGERDSMIVMARLSPEYTGQLVDEWRAMRNHIEKMRRPEIPQQTEKEKLDAVEQGISLMERLHGEVPESHKFLFSDRVQNIFIGDQLLTNGSGTNLLWSVVERARHLGFNPNEKEARLLGQNAAREYRNQNDRKEPPEEPRYVGGTARPVKAYPESFLPCLDNVIRDFFK